MQTIIITGSTRGIGFGLAQAFLARGCAVVISGRQPDAVEAACHTLAADYAPARVFGQACDVNDYAQVHALWEAAVTQFGAVDIWINNAGIGHPTMKLWELEPQQLSAVVTTNIIGTLYGSRVAIRGMLAQERGALYNMEGMGSDGRKHDGLALYGSTKYALHYLNESLIKEVQGTPLIVGLIRPGMVITDLITRQYEARPEEWARAKKIFNLIAERVETVTPWLADRILANRKNGALIQYNSRLKLLGRFLTAPFNQRDLFNE